MKVKWGKCPDCDPNDKDKPLVAKRCKYHNERYKQSLKETGDPAELPYPKRRAAIKKVSDKEAARLRKYYKIRADWLPNHEYCEIRLIAACTFYATDVHHTKGRIGDLLFNTKWWKAGCRACHQHAENHPKEAKEKEVTFNRLSNE